MEQGQGGLGLVGDIVDHGVERPAETGGERLKVVTVGAHVVDAVVRQRTTATGDTDHLMPRPAKTWQEMMPDEARAADHENPHRSSPFTCPVSVGLKGAWKEPVQGRARAISLRRRVLKVLTQPTPGISLV